MVKIENIQPTLEAIFKEGGTPMIVGGFVRDALLGINGTMPFWILRR